MAAVSEANIQDMITQINGNLDGTQRINAEMTGEITTLRDELATFTRMVYQFQQNIFLKLLACCKNIGSNTSNIDLQKLLQDLTELNQKIGAINQVGEANKGETAKIKKMLQTNTVILNRLFTAIETFNAECNTDCNYVIKLQPIAIEIYNILHVYKDNANIFNSIVQEVGIIDIPGGENLQQLQADIAADNELNAKKYIIKNYLVKLLQGNKITQQEYDDYITQLNAMTGGRRKKRKSTKRHHKRSHKSPRKRFKRSSKRAFPRRTHRYRFHI